jgi:hypothetical protein
MITPCERWPLPAPWTLNDHERRGSGASVPGTNKSPGNPFVLRKGLKGSLQTEYIFEELEL